MLLFAGVAESKPEAAPGAVVAAVPAADEASGWGGSGCDELNLAEFPLTLLAGRAPPDLRTLKFSDTIFDRGAGRSVERTLTVTGSAEYGLPTAADADVLLALVQATTAQGGWGTALVSFCRRALLRTLRWDASGKTYARLDLSLRRWAGTTLYYDNAWWDRSRRAWVSEYFHVLDRVAVAAAAGATTVSVAWNEIVARSLRAENTKPLDPDLYFGLRLATSRRLYRFLDKRFGVHGRWEFDLRVLACEHIGLARDCPTGELKRRLSAGLVELERVGFLEPLPAAERYLRPATAAGTWRVLCQPARPGTPPAALPAVLPRTPATPATPATSPLSVTPTPTPTPVVLPAAPVPSFTAAAPAAAAQAVPDAAAEAATGNLLVAELCGFGLDERGARRLLAQAGPAVVRLRLDVYAWLVRKNDPRVSRNGPGFLAESIRKEYAVPPGFQSPEVASLLARHGPGAFATCALAIDEGLDRPADQVAAVPAAARHQAAAATPAGDLTPEGRRAAAQLQQRRQEVQTDLAASAARLRPLAEFWAGLDEAARARHWAAALAAANEFLQSRYHSARRTHGDDAPATVNYATLIRDAYLAGLLEAAGGG